MQIGFIGAGYMGYGIALNLLKSGHSLRVVANRRRERVEKLVAQGAVEAHDYAELLADTETGKILIEALERYFTHQLTNFSADTLLSELLVPEEQC